MGYGFKAVNGANSFMIDENYANMRLADKATIYKQKPFAFSDDWYSHAFASYSYSETNVFYAWLSNGFPLMQYAAASVVVADSTAGNDFDAGTKYPMNAYAIAPTSNVADFGGYGLKTRNASGALVYHSNLPYPKIVEVITGSNYQSGIATRTYTSGRTYAVMFLRPSGRLIVTFGSGFYATDQYGLFVTINNNVVSFSERLFYHNYDAANSGKYPSPAPGTFSNLAYAIAIIDVTGL